MASLKDLVSEFGLAGSEEESQVKTASAAKTTSEEVEAMLDNLGVLDSETVKTAAQASKKDGGTMNLMDLYNDFTSEKTASETAAAAASTEVTSEQAAATTEAAQTTEVAGEGEGSEKVAGDATELFGNLVGGYFNEQFESMIEKCAADLESEAGKGESPMAHLGNSGGLTNVIGKEGDPHLHVNYPASGGAALKVTTGGHSPYSLAVKQKILKRMAGEGIVGEQK